MGGEKGEEGKSTSQLRTTMTTSPGDEDDNAIRQRTRRTVTRTREPLARPQEPGSEDANEDDTDGDRSVVERLRVDSCKARERVRERKSEGAEEEGGETRREKTTYG